MYYRIDDITTDEDLARDSDPFAGIVVYVSFWAAKAQHDDGHPPQWQEDFRMQIRPSKTRVITDRNGHWRRSDGVFIDPESLTLAQRVATQWSRETVINDVAAEVRGNIERYLKRQPNKHGDQRDRRVRKSTRDPKGILQRQAVRDLRGKGREVSR